MVTSIIRVKWQSGYASDCKSYLCEFESLLDLGGSLRADVVVGLIVGW